MQVKCVRAFGYHKPGDAVELPDGAAFDTEHYQAAPAPPPSPPAAPALPALGVTPKEGM